MSLINLYNPIWWDDDGSPPITCDTEYTLPVVAGDTLSFYINFYNDFRQSPDNWQLGWWTEGGIVIRNIAAITELNIDGINRNLYASVTIGVLPRSLLRLVIYDPTDSDDIKFWSVGFRYKTATTGTTVMKWRNYQSILNFEFELATSFYNECRIDCRIGEPVTELSTDGYETSTGHTVVSKSVHKMTYELETQDFDYRTHAGFNAATRMSDLYFDNIRYERPAGGQYIQETVGKDYSFWLGRVRLEQYNYTAVASNT